MSFDANAMMYQQQQAQKGIGGAGSPYAIAVGTKLLTGTAFRDTQGIHAHDTKGIIPGLTGSDKIFSGFQSQSKGGLADGVFKLVAGNRGTISAPNPVSGGHDFAGPVHHGVSMPDVGGRGAAMEMIH